jgi:hypothetical protein
MEMKSIIFLMAFTGLIACKPKERAEMANINDGRKETEQTLEEVPDEQNTDTEENTGPAYPAPKPGCSEMGWNLHLNPSGVQSDPFTLVDARMSGRCLEITVKHGGGCGGAVFSLLWDGSLAESLPEQARFRLVLDNQDRCRALITRTLSIDIATVNQGRAFEFRIDKLDKTLRFEP